MNLDHHAALILRYRWVALGGLLLAGVLALLAAYQVPSFERRGGETWTSASNILVTQPGFPEGRVTLPDQMAIPGATAAPVDPTSGADRDRQRFADPQRLASLALLYADIAASEQVRSKLPGTPAPGQIGAVAVDATGNGTTYLPIIALTTQAATPAEAQRLNVQAFRAFEELLQSRQKANDIPLTDRIRLSVLDPPSASTLVSGRSLTPSLLAFVLCCLATLALIHILEALRQRREDDIVPVFVLDDEPDVEWEPVELAPGSRKSRQSG